MLPAAGLALVLLLLTCAVPSRLARASWPRRAPSAGLLLWQALGLAGGLLAVEALATLALSAAGDTHPSAVRALVRGTGLPWWALLAGAFAVALVARLLVALLVSATRTLRERHRNRVLVDLVATRNPLLARTRVVDHDVPLAYCLPGLLRPRVVLSRGVLDLLREDEVRAVLAHETAHVEQRHDLVVLPFLALGRSFPRLPPVGTASASVALLVEMLADDRAARRHRPEVLARALYKVGSAQVPAGGLGAGGTGEHVLVRAQRLVSPAPPLSTPARAAAAAATVAVLALPLLVLLLPQAFS